MGAGQIGDPGQLALTEPVQARHLILSQTRSSWGTRSMKNPDLLEAL
jgi:hypothetical protein